MSARRGYRVFLATTASVSTCVTVDAEDEDEAKLLAVKEATEGNVVWNYDGANTDEIEIYDVD